MIPSTLSFRDPAGSCFTLQGRVLRWVRREWVEPFDALLQSPFIREQVTRRRLVPTEKLDPAAIAAMGTLADLPLQPGDALYEHERIRFPSYPSEWPAEMLWAAGDLTLNLTRAALADGYGMKDATPRNVLFRGNEPVFVDLLSFEPRPAGDPLWPPCAQFIRTFLLPLLAHQRWGIRLVDVFLTRRDGLEPEEVYRLCGPLEKFAPGLFSLVTLPTWLSRGSAARNPTVYKPRTLANPEKARFILASLLDRLQGHLASLRPRSQRPSVWSRYMETHGYEEPAFAAKEQFVRDCLREFKPAFLLDIGANTGHFSELAARAGVQVVAIDLDPTCVGAIWNRARQAGSLHILPLVVDLARPSPALGWGNTEIPSFLERAAGAFDGVLMLAVLHHLLVTERIPLDEILRLAANLTTSLLIIEFVPPEDDRFRLIARGREHLHASLDAATFERACARHFEMLRVIPLPPSLRRLYCLRRKRDAV